MFLAPHSPYADHVSEEHAREFERLIRAIDSAGRFRLLFAEFNQQFYRDSYIERLNAYYPSSAVLYVEREKLADASQLRARLHELAQTHRMIQVAEAQVWQATARHEWLRHLNAQRELLAQDCPVVLLFWLDEAVLKQLAVTAPDLWSWRSGVFNFVVTAQPSPMQELSPVPAATLALTEQQRRRQRIAELTEYLQNNAVSEALRASLLLEQGDLHQSIGELNEAMACFQTSLDLYRQRHDEANIAELLDRVAGILQARGELDEALRIRQQEILPICKRLGDVRSKAVTMGQIADILYRRGELDEALRIRQQEQLPIFEKLGDVREKAVTMGKIADILEKQGKLAEAISIYEQEVLPAYEKLGDSRLLIVDKANLALKYLRFTPPRRAEANQLLCQALRAAKKMRIPEAGQIEEWLRYFKMKC